jgi:hypothetical protein
MKPPDTLTPGLQRAPDYSFHLQYYYYLAFIGGESTAGTKLE